MMPNIKWTPEQTAVLTEHYGSKGIKFVVALLGFNERRVLAKAHSLGLRVEGIKWTPEHIAAMTEHYSAKGPKFVAALIGKTEKQVMAKAHYMGLHFEFRARKGVLIPVKPKSDGPTLVIAQPRRGPAYSDGPMVFTDKTRRTVCPSMPQPTFSNTHSSY